MESLVWLKSLKWLDICQTIAIVRDCKWIRITTKVSLLGVDSLWGDCTFIPADWGS